MSAGAKAAPGLPAHGGAQGLLTLAAAAFAEAAMAGASLAIGGTPAGWFGAALALICVAIAVVDARFFIIPDLLSFAAVILGVILAAASGPGDEALARAGSALFRGAVLGLVFFAIREAYARLRAREGIGLGDVKLAAAAGVWLDWTLIPFAVELAALAGLCAYAVARILRRRPLEGAARLPFGLFFAPAIWICWLAGALWGA